MGSFYSFHPKKTSEKIIMDDDFLFFFCWGWEILWSFCVDLTGSIFPFSANWIFRFFCFPIPDACKKLLKKIQKILGKPGKHHFWTTPSKKNCQWIITRSFSYFPICRKNNGKIILRIFLCNFHLIQTTKVNMKNYGKKNCCVEIYVIIFYITNETSENEGNGKKSLYDDNRYKWKIVHFRLLLS